MEQEIIEDATVVEETINEEVKESKPEVVAFDYGDLSMTCSCGGEFTIGEGIKNGISLVLPTNDAAVWIISCNKCNTTMKIFFKESSEEVKKIAKEKEEELKRKQDEQIQQGDNAQDNGEGLSGDDQSVVDVNA